MPAVLLLSASVIAASFWAGAITEYLWAAIRRRHDVR